MLEGLICLLCFLLVIVLMTSCKLFALVNNHDVHLVNNDRVTVDVQIMTFSSQCLKSSLPTVSWSLRETNFRLSAGRLSSTRKPLSPGWERVGRWKSPPTRRQACLCTPATVQTWPSCATVCWWRTWQSHMKVSGAVRLVCASEAVAQNAQSPPSSQKKALKP